MNHKWQKNWPSLYRNVSNVAEINVELTCPSASRRMSAPAGSHYYTRHGVIFVMLAQTDIKHGLLLNKTFSRGSKLAL